MNWGITWQSPPCKTLFLYTCHTEIKAHTSILSLMCLRASAVPWKSSSSGMVTKSNFSFGLQRLVKIWWNCVSAESSTIIMISGKKINTWTCYCCWAAKPYWGSPKCGRAFPGSVTNQKHHPNLSSDTSSVWNFFAHSSDVISQGNQWWHCKMLAVFSG